LHPLLHVGAAGAAGVIFNAAALPFLNIYSGQSLLTSQSGFLQDSSSQFAGFWQGYLNFWSHPAAIKIGSANIAMANL
jgi:hypothetical protein